jgi:hypothetical protein
MSIAIADARLACVFDASLAARARVFPRARVDGDADDVFAAGARETRRRGVGMSTKRRVVDCGDEETVTRSAHYNHVT